MTSQRSTRPRVEATQLLVIGAGPVGLFAALCGARSGLEVTLLEQNYRSAERGHAALLHASSLRLLEEMGLSEPMLRAGRRIAEVDVYVEGIHRQRLELKAPALSIAQNVLEELLLQAVRAEDVIIHSPCQGSELTAHPDFVQTRVLRRELTPPGSPPAAAESEPIESWLVDSAFVIGADGHESRVRTALAIENTVVGPSETFAQFEGPNTSSSSSSTLELGFHAGLGSISFPLPGERTRWGFQLASDLHAPADVPRLHALLAEHSPWTTCRPTTLDWSTVSHFERRLAQRFGSGRVCLAGDAAHVTSPFGGQSMNRGLCEAQALVAQIAACVFRGASVATLTQLGAAHEREWHQLLGFHVQYGPRPGSPAWLAEQAPRILPALPASGRDLQHLLTQLGLVLR